MPPPAPSTTLVSLWHQHANALGDSILNWAKPADFPVGPTRTWPLADSGTAFAIAVGYLAFVGVGVAVMPRLPAVPGLYPFKFVYNMVQVMLCSYIAIETGVRAWDAGYSLLPCNTFNHKNPPMAFVLYVFYLSKLLDFMDTFFIIAEKRWSQLSFLHVYHHFSVFLAEWQNFNVGYDGDVYLHVLLNAFIHTVMYTYYFVSMHTKDIWWKSALTLGQIIQFMTMNAQGAYMIYTGCTKYPPNLLWTYLYYVLSLLVLFVHFYLMAYIFGGGKKKRGTLKDDKKSQ